MSRANRLHRQIISEKIMIARLNRSDEMRGFFIQMWIQNPQLARQGGAKVRELLTPANPIHASD
jgi:hypothetical protein